MLPGLKFNTGFTPTSISGCQLWFDAADLTSLTLSGSNLTAIRDKSGVTSPTITGGFLYASNSLNGYGVIYNNNGYIRANFPTPFTSSVHTTFLVMVATSLPSDGTRAMSFRAPAGLPIRPLDYAFGSFRYLVRNPNTTGQAVTAFTNSYFIWTCYNSTFNLGLRLNGATDLTTNISTNTTTITGYGFGWNDEGDTQINFPGRIAESLVFNTVLTTAQIERIEAYLAQKWALKNNLPAGHPGITTTIYPSRRQAIMTSVPYFMPTNISGCQLWMDAADSSIVTGTSPVTAWIDKSSNAYSFSGTGAVRSNIGSTINTSLFFNGSSYLTNNSISITFPITVFTVAYQSTNNGFQRILNGLSGSAYDYVLFMGASGTSVAVFSGIGGAWVDINFNSPATNSHLAMMLISTTVSGGTVTTYANGTTLDSKSGGGSAGTTFTGFNIGGGVGSLTTGTQTWNGHICEIIVYSGVLTTTQRQQVESYLAQKWGLTASLPVGHLNTSFPTGTPSFTQNVFRQVKRTIVATNPSTRYSAFFSSANNTLSMPSNAVFELGTNNHTIEFWFYHTSRGLYDTIFAYGNNPPQWTSRSNYYINMGSNQFLVILGNGSGGWEILLSGGTLVTLNTWHHYALVRNGSTFTLYINGTSRGTATTSAPIGTQVGSLVVGSYGVGGADGFTGYISNFRFVVGTAVYTSNFTPPTSPLTAIPNTQLLIQGLVDRSPNAFTLTNTNNVTLSTTLSPFA